MQFPARLVPLEDQGIITRVLRPLMSGKEADVFLVEVRGDIRVAKVYKESHNRSFKHRADYTEGRKVRNSRRQRAMSKRSKYGRQQVEEAWRTAEVDVIYKLHYAGVKVPIPHDFLDGVLVMQLVADHEGRPAPRLVDVTFSKREAEEVFHLLLSEVVKMLCCGVVHGDLSDFNVLMGTDGPVIIDFPQAVDPTNNRNAKKLLIRDVDNLAQFLGRFSPKLRRTRYGQEMWNLYERGELTPTTTLSGRFKDSTKKANTDALLQDIEEVEEEYLRANPDAKRRKPARRVVVIEPPQPKKTKRNNRRNKPKTTSQKAQNPRGPGKPKPAPVKASDPNPANQGAGSGETEAPKKKRRRRRRRRKGPPSSTSQ